MRYRKLAGPHRDYSFGHGAADFWRDQPEAPGQAVETRLGLYQGSWFLDAAEGTAWQTKVLGVGTAGLHDIELRRRILGTQGVRALVTFASQRTGETRGLAVQATVQTIYGDAPVSYAPRTSAVVAASGGAAPVIAPPPALPANVLAGPDGQTVTGADGELLTGPN